MKTIRYSAPARVDLSGGAADIFGLSTLSVAIDIRATCTISENNDGRLMFDIGRGPVPMNEATDKHYDILRHIVRRFSIDDDITIKVDTEIPMSSGLGGSASISVSVIKALSDWKNMDLDEYYVAEHAQRVETKNMGLKNGYQDQYCAAFGGCLFMDFKDKDNREVGMEPFAMIEKLPFKYNLVVANTGIKHNSGEVNAKVYDKYYLGDERIVTLIRRLDIITRELRDGILDDDFFRISEIINENQAVIREFERSTEENEKLIEMAFSNGASAAKVTGAGCGGSIAALCENKKIAKTVYKELVQISPFAKICNIDEGVRIEI